MYIDSLYNSHYRYDATWTPTPFYSLIFLFVLFLPYGKYLYALQGILIGCIFLACAYKFISSYIFPHRPKLKTLTVAMIACCLQSTIFSSMISSSTMGIFAVLVISALLIKNSVVQSLILAFATLIRSTSIIYIISVLFSVLICKPKNYRKVVRVLIFPIICFGIMYVKIYSGYGLSFPSTIFISQGALSWANFFNDYLYQTLNIEQPYEYFKENGGGLSTLFSFVGSFKEVHFILVNFYQKLLMMVGFPWDVHFSGEPSLVQPRLWITKTMYITWFWVFIAPGLLVFAKGFTCLKLPRKLRTIIMTYVTFIILSSSIIAGERYSLLFIPILIFTSTIFWIENRLLKELLPD